MKKLFSLFLAIFLLVGCGTSTNYVTIKYRDDAVDIDHSRFEYLNTSDSSFVHGAWYDEENGYMVIKLKETYYHYCGMPRSVWTSFRGVDSFGTYYTDSIKGDFDCRNNFIPSYKENNENFVTEKKNNNSLADYNDYIPENYEFFNSFYENVDNDAEDEIILLLKQSRNYQSDVEFDTLPVIIKVLDNKKGVWLSSEATMEANHNAYPQTDNDEEKPYRIYNKGDEKWIVLNTLNGSFSGVSYFVDIFLYSESYGLFNILTVDDGRENNALTSVVDKVDEIFMFTCNPWDMWAGIVDEDQLMLNTYVISLKSERPTIHSMDFDFKCKLIEDGFDGMMNIESEAFERLLNENEVYL